MRMCADSKIEAKPGNFASRIDSGVLLVPSVLADLAQAQHLQSAEEFAGYARTFPSAVAASLGWKPAAAAAAAQRLSDQLSNAGVLRVVASPPRVYGLG
ncbi:hypothetical protein [Rugamonas rubra]|uniref:Uncharacterized protein n=1 Tax=Rugamonas rubra TaxID=758825 RepID=A0A1I4PLK2_9BURK|nr:hypothetical protein [Rugamonas rubra]SFM28425.1 hypothetical protein SAMN02982985_03506 [Rugamonas rubra]